jgi:photosystem II stability/assembly factor-like uncharacterized protein
MLKNNVLIGDSTNPILPEERWQQTNLPYDVHVLCFTVDGMNIFAGTTGGIFLSTDNGKSWSGVYSGLTNSFTNALALSGSNLFAATSEGVFLSTNNGTNWTYANSGMPYYDGYSVLALAAIGANIFAAKPNCGVFLSTNNGASWTDVNSNLTNNLINCLLASGTNLFAGDYQGGIHLSTNSGTSWTDINTGLRGNQILTMAENGNTILVGSYSGGAFRTTDNGASWADINSGLSYSYTVNAFAVSGKNIFTLTGDGKVYYSPNNGTNWIVVNPDWSEPSFYSLAVSDMYLFVGTDKKGIWRYPLSKVNTSVLFSSSKVPSKFILEQNYPNPFNPSTKISYVVPVLSNVKVVVYDRLGREVETLIDKEHQPGYYDIDFNADKLASGVYFYRIQAGTFVETKKMVLLK